MVKLYGDDTSWEMSSVDTETKNAAIKRVERMLRIAKVEQDPTKIWGPINIHPQDKEALETLLLIARGK